MMSKTVGLALLLAFAEARFGQEQIPVAAIQALSSFGSPGQAATLAGAVPGSLLAGANACAQVQLADKIVSTLGNNAQVIAAAAKLVAAEKNFNPFAVSIPSICDDATLPATAALRGIVPLVDPSVVGADVQNKNSAASLTTPFSGNGLSIAGVSKAQGFSNFTAQAVDGTNTAASGASGAATGAATSNAATGNTATGNTATSGAANNGTAKAGNNAKGGATTNAKGGSTTQCGGSAKAGAKASGAKSGGSKAGAAKASTTAAGAANTAAASTTTTNTNTTAANAATSNTGANAATSNTGANAGATTNAAAGTPGLTVSSNSTLDFGTCNPAMSFIGGRANRAATEFTFNSVDPRILSIQQEALNPNIITNRICDEVQNRCSANQAAIQACLSNKAALLAKDINTVKVAATATNWNAALGFGNVNINSATV